MKRSVLPLLSGIVFLNSALPVLAQTGDPVRGEYIMQLGGCVSCHQTPKQKDKPLGGGLPLKTDFGTFYVPNISPDPSEGIGGWTLDQFKTAMREGKNPNGQHYYPAFPYTSYTLMSDQDLTDLKAYLDSVPADNHQVPDHDVSFPFNLRFLMFGWKALFFADGQFEQNTQKSDSWNRGAYIVKALSHCGECHTPRNKLGGTDQDRFGQGNPVGAHGEKIPAMFPKWEITDYYTFLRMGMDPEGDFVGSSMTNVIKNTTSKLNKDDLRAVVEFLNDPQ